MKWYVFLLLGFCSGIGFSSSADPDRWVFSKDVEPKHFKIDRNPESDLKWEICLYALASDKTSEPDLLGIHGPNEKNVCPGEEELNSRTKEQREADKSLNSVYNPVNVEMTGTAFAKVRVKNFDGKTVFVTREVKYKKVAGLKRAVAKTPEGKSRFDTLCLVQVESVGGGEYAEDFLVCNRDKSNSKVFTCPSIQTCVGQQPTFNIVLPTIMSEGERPHGQVGNPGSRDEKGSGRPQDTH